MRKITFIIITLANILFAQTTSVYHINGINTTYGEADRNKKEIEKVLLSTYKSQNLVYHLAYNQTEGAVKDILDFYRQKVAEDRQLHPEKTQEQVNQLISDITACISGDCEDNSLMLQVKEMQLKSIIDSNGTYEDEDSVNIRNAIKSGISNGDNVLIVAHSQGTMYANIVYEKLMGVDKINEDKIKILSVAEMANAMPNGDWISSAGDLVISAVRLIYDTLPFNITEIGNDGHNLIDTYLKKDSLLLTTFRNKANALLDTFEDVVFDGNITVVFHNAAKEKNFSVMNLPWIKDNNGTLLWVKYPSVSNPITVGDDISYIQVLPLSDEINGTYSAQWILNDTNVTSASLYCGGDFKTISVDKYSTNDFGKFVINKLGEGYRCRVE